LNAQFYVGFAVAAGLGLVAHFFYTVMVFRARNRRIERARLRLVERYSGGPASNED